MKLSEDQIQKLYKFTRQHCVEHYDLQTELVDHLANGIEAQWRETPDLAFQNALKSEFKKFGAGGFEKVVRKRKRTMELRYCKIIFRFYKEYFKLPRVLFLTGAIFLMTLLIGKLPVTLKYPVLLGGLFLIVFGVLFIHFKKRRNNELKLVKYGKRWMLKDQIYTFGNLANLINLIPISLNFPYFQRKISTDSIYIDLSFAVLFVCIMILCYTVVYVIPKKADQLLAETYPEYKMTYNL